MALHTNRGTLGTLATRGMRYLTRTDMVTFLRDQRSVGCVGRQALNVANHLGMYTDHAMPRRLHIQILREMRAGMSR